MRKIFDVIIVGAGASGLACADALIKQKKSVLVVESQNRVGGRAVSVPKMDFPVELGAEFIHGYPKPTVQLMDRLRADFYDVEDKRFVWENGKLGESKNFWDVMEAYTTKIEKSKRPDRSVQDFINTQREGASLKMFASFVEGFHAADLNVIGEKGFADAEEVQEEDNLNGAEMFRLTKGYSNLWQKMLSADSKLKQNILLRTTVSEIDYSGRHVQLTATTSGKTKKLRARKVVITASVGVLKSSPNHKMSILWKPAAPKNLLKFLDSVEMGHIQKITFQFRERFWEKEFKEKKATFYHAAPENYFPTWWNFQPLRVPFLVAWQGGPKAQEMAQWKEERITEQALETLGRIFNKAPAFLRNQKVAAYFKNWSHDESFLGAYSNIRVNGLAGSKALRHSLDKKVYFAGEATEGGSSRATVHGALKSGQRVAAEILKNL